MFVGNIVNILNLFAEIQVALYIFRSWGRPEGSTAFLWTPGNISASCTTTLSIVSYFVNDSCSCPPPSPPAPPPALFNTEREEEGLKLGYVTT
jgi:hypothetical protein